MNHSSAVSNHKDPFWFWKNPREIIPLLECQRVLKTVLKDTIQTENKHITLLHSLSAASPCCTMVWRMKEVTAASMTSPLTPPWARRIRRREISISWIRVYSYKQLPSQQWQRQLLLRYITSFVGCYLLNYACSVFCSDQLSPSFQFSLALCQSLDLVVAPIPLVPHLEWIFAG